MKYDYCTGVIHTDSKFLLSLLLFLLSVQLLHKLSVRAADGPQRLLRMIKNPVSDHLPAGCPRYTTSFKAGDAICPRTLVPKDGPAVVVIGAFAHGAVGLSSHLLDLWLSNQYSESLSLDQWFSHNTDVKQKCRLSGML